MIVAGTKGRRNVGTEEGSGGVSSSLSPSVPASLPSVSELLNDHVPGHSEFQIERFIVDKSGVTPYGKYKQALRELDKRQRAVDAFARNIRRCQIDLDEWASESPGARRTFDQRRHDIAVEEKHLEMTALRDGLAETRRELDVFHAQAIALKAEVGELTDERRAALDECEWVETAYRIAVLESMASGQPSRNTLEMIVVLPEAARNELMWRLWPKRCQEFGKALFGPAARMKASRPVPLPPPPPENETI